MKPIFVVSGMLLAALLGAAGGWVAGVCNATKLDYSVMQIQREAEQANLFVRFQTAYQSMPPNVALWEGTNLLSYLEKHPPEGSRKEQILSQVILNTRLSRLFGEMGKENEGQLYAKQAYVLFKSVFPNTKYSQGEVISNTLQAAYLKRTFVDNPLK